MMRYDTIYVMHCMDGMIGMARCATVRLIYHPTSPYPPFSSTIYSRHVVVLWRPKTERCRQPESEVRCSSPPFLPSCLPTYLPTYLPSYFTFLIFAYRITALLKNNFAVGSVIFNVCATDMNSYDKLPHARQRGT